LSGEVDWVLLRGLYRQSAHWHSFPTRLKEAFPGSRVLVIDLPGCGKNREVPSPTTIEGIVEFLRAEDKDPKRPRAILSISMGSMVALDWCARYPGEFDQLVVMNTSARDLGAFWQRFRPRAWPLIARALRPGGSVAARERAILELTSNLPESARRKAEAANVAIEAENPFPTMTGLLQLRAASRFKAPDRVAVPTCVLRSLNDRLVDSRCSGELAKRLGAELHTHSEAGHDLPLDDPEWVIQKLRGLVPFSKAGEPRK
jgi:pimeloyl-[acyl-carrier protein] methyl ester esterase